MGTSISQHSPRTPKWKPVHVCYENDKIPEDIILNEIWKAADNPTEPVRWANEMKSDIVYKCYEIITASSNSQNALKKIHETILSTKSNSIVTEFAKRAIPAAYLKANPSAFWANNLFSEITNYVISRDISGFVGENYRNKSVKELFGFKKRLISNLNQILKSVKFEIKTKKDWNTYIDNAIAKLKANK